MIGRHWLLSRGPNSHLIKLNVIVLQVEQEAFTRELVAVWTSMKLQPQSHRCLYYCYLARAVFFANRPKIQRKQYSDFVAGVIDEEDTLKYSRVLVLGVYELI